jgi:hypothetical protein
VVWSSGSHVDSLIICFVDWAELYGNDTMIIEVSYQSSDGLSGNVVAFLSIRLTLNPSTITSA